MSNAQRERVNLKVSRSISTVDVRSVSISVILDRYKRNLQNPFEGPESYETPSFWRKRNDEQKLDGWMDRI